MPVKRRSSKKTNMITGILLLVVIVAAGCFVGYRFLTKEKKTEEIEKAPATEMEKLLAKDIEGAYPGTPDELMKLWCRYNQCIYNNASADDEEMGALLKKVRILFSEELLEKNTQEAHLEKLKKEVEEFRSEKKIIISCSTETGEAPVYKTIKNRESVRVKISYFIKCGDEYVKQYQVYILVRENDKWKILGFKKASKEEIVSEKEALEGQKEEK